MITPEDATGYFGVARPGSHMLTLGRNLGMLEAYVDDVMKGRSNLRDEYEFVKPQKWQRALGLPTKKQSGAKDDKQWKRFLKSKAMELYPDIHPSDKTADALLILKYAMLTYP